MDVTTAIYASAALGVALVAWIYWSPIRAWLEATPGVIAAGLIVLGAAAGGWADGPRGVLIGVVAGGLVALIVRRDPAPVSSVSDEADCDYVEDEPAATSSAASVRVAEQPERPQIVQAERPPNGDDLTLEDTIRIDSAARLLAAGVQGEAAAIELFFDGVKRGGSKRYQTIRDAVRLLAAARYDWRPPAPAPEPAAPQRTPIAGREVPGGVIFQELAADASAELAGQP